jgi:hypothetical protein
MDRHSSDANSISDKISEGPVKLTETAKVLDLLLSIVYRLDRAKPNLRRADFDVLKAVAEAAEKYFIDIASGICEMYMWCAQFCNILVTQYNGILVSTAQSTP